MWGLDVPRATAAGVALDCFQAPACAAAQPRAPSALDRLAARVRRHPVSGVVDVSAVGPRRVVVDERALIALADGTGATSPSSPPRRRRSTAATSSRCCGWPVSSSGSGSCQTDLEIYSAGNNAAVLCNDADSSGTAPTRSGCARPSTSTRWRNSPGATRSTRTAPSGWDEYYLPRYCTYWPEPDRFTPAIPHGTKVTDVPTLILSGDRDTVVPIRTTREYLRVFPNASFLPVAGAGHTAAAWSECAFDAFHSFVRDLDSPSRAGVHRASACRGSRLGVPQAGPRSRARPTPAGGDTSTSLQRKVVTAAVLAVRDGWVRSFKDPASVNPFSGLRGGGGTFNYDGWPTNLLDLQAAATSPTSRSPASPSSSPTTTR